MKGFQSCHSVVHQRESKTLEYSVRDTSNILSQNRPPVLLPILECCQWWWLGVAAAVLLLKLVYKLNFFKFNGIISFVYCTLKLTNAMIILYVLYWRDWIPFCERCRNKNSVLMHLLFHFMFLLYQNNKV